MIEGSIGNRWAEDLLEKHLRSERVRHAYLISGEQGLGKRALALRFAQALNCSGAGGEAWICGDCRACSLIPEGAYPDLHILEPEADSETIKIEQVRTLQQQLALSPYEGRWRVALIPDFERASDGAANALLKTLEEPAGRVVLILTASDAALLLPTIVSRCEQLRLRPVPTEMIVNALRQRGLPGERARLLAGIAQNRPGWALRYAEHPETLESRAQQLTDLRQLLHAERGFRFDYLDDLLPTRTDLETQRRAAVAAVLTWSSVWRDALHRGFNPGFAIANLDQEGLIDEIGGGLSVQQMQAGLSAFHRAVAAIERFANTRLAMEVLMIDLPMLSK